MDFRTSATKDLSALLDRLSQVAEAVTKAARAEATAEAQVTIDAVNAQRATVQQALQEQTDASDAAGRANEALQRANAALEAERDKIAQDLEAARAELSASRADIASTREELTSSRAELAIARAEAAAEAQVAIDTVNAQRATVQHALQEQTNATDTAERANEALQRAHAALETERAKIAQDFEAARAELTAAHAKLAELEAARAEAAAEAQGTIDAVNAQRATLQHALQEQTDATDAAERANETLQRAHAALEIERAKIAQDFEAARAELTAAHAKVAELETARAEAAAEAQGTIDAVNAQRATVQHALQEQTEATDAAKRANEALQSERAKIAEDLDAARAELTASRAEVEVMRADLDALRTVLRSAHVDHEALQKEFEALRAEAIATQAASESLLAEANAAQQALQAKFDDAVRSASETSARALQWRAEEGRTIRDQAVGLVSRTLDRMLAVTTAFANVSTEDDVLAAVAEAMATEFPRVALFEIALDRLDVLQHMGFEFPTDYAHLVVPQPIAAVLDRAVTSGQIEMLSADAIAAAAGTPFGGTPTCALALPVDLEGEACAVLYADDSGAPYQTLGSTDLRRTFALVLRQLAAPLLARFPAEMKAIAELRAYAAHLVAELENMYAADIESRKKGNELRRRLQDNLECARGIYAQRVSSEAPAAAPLLEKELALAASVAHGTPFGRDLSALLSAAESRVAEA